MLLAECHIQSVAASLEQQQIDLAAPEFQSVLDVSTLLKLSAAGDHMKDDGGGECEHKGLSLYSKCIQQ